jgi:hypothetical protein
MLACALSLSCPCPARTLLFPSDFSAHLGYFTRSEGHFFKLDPLSHPHFRVSPTPITRGPGRICVTSARYFPLSSHSETSASRPHPRRSRVIVTLRNVVSLARVDDLPSDIVFPLAEPPFPRKTRHASGHIQVTVVLSESPPNLCP